jgi:hypothetical protein
VNGSVLDVLDFDAPTLVLLGVLEVGSFVGSLDFSSEGVFSSLEGEVPVLGFGVVGVVGVVVGVFGVGAVWLYPLVGSAARALAGRSSTAAISAATGTTRSLPKLLDGPVLIRVARVFRDLLEATTSIRVMPTSRW